jgi:hypothetical protein
MTDSEPDPQADSDDSPREPRLLSPAEAAAATGLARKAITGRMDRGTLRVVRDESGTRRVPRAELVRAGLLNASHPGESPDKSASHPGELVRWEDLYERERAKAEALAESERELYAQLAAIANAGPIRALRLRRQLRTVSATDASLDAASGFRTA